MRLAASAVAQAAEAYGIPLFKPESLRDPEAQACLAAQSADVMVVAAFGLILPAAALAIPRLGCINIHASLLPRWRGAAPIQRAILAGDGTTGITIMRMDAGLDTGPALLARPHPIGERESSGTLTEALAALGAAAIVEALDRLDSLMPQPQDAARATYAAKIEKAEARIDWSRPGRSSSTGRSARSIPPPARKRASTARRSRSGRPSRWSAAVRPARCWRPRPAASWWRADRGRCACLRSSAQAPGASRRARSCSAHP